MSCFVLTHTMLFGFGDYCHFGVDSVYHYYHYKRYVQWQIAKAWIDKPLFMTVVSVLIAVLALSFGYFKPKTTGAMSAVATLAWTYM